MQEYSGVMFCDDVTIFRYDENTESYKKDYLKGVYWYGNETLKQSGKSIDVSKGITIVVPENNIDNTDIKVGDYVVKGILVENISSLKELKKYDFITVTSIDCNSPLSPLNLKNIVISGV